MKKFFICFLFLILLTSCESAREGFTLKKKDNSDEMDISKDQNKAGPIGIDEDKENQRNLPTDEFFRLDVEVCLKCKSCGYSR